MNNNNYTFITYLLLVILIFVIFSLSFKYKFKTAQKLSFRSLTNKNSNASIKENYNNMNIKEGFKEGLTESNYNKNETDSIFKMIDNKLRGLTLELGGNEGRNETKKILTSTKKICDMECAKCMMAMLNDKKSINTINFEGILDDETDENCIKCKKYSELSTSITSIINNL
jgi:hypothetical protein